MRPARREQLTFADLAFEQQGVVLDPEMRVISDILTRCPELTNIVKRELTRGLCPRKGRPGLEAECVLRAFVLWRMKDCSFRELRERIADGHVLRQFVGLGMGTVPKHDAFQRAFARLSPDAVREINDLVLRHAVREGITCGDKVRIDSTVVESNIRYPTDADLLAGGVRVLTRLVNDVRALVPQAAEGFHDRVRRTKKCAYLIQRIARGKDETRLRRAYRVLLRLSHEVTRMARTAADRALATLPADPIGEIVVKSASENIRHFAALVVRAHDQARRRIVEGESVPAAEKLVSLFEPHASIIVRGKAGKPVEFGHKLFLSETAEGLVVHYEVADGNPPDSPWVTSALERHRELFGRVPAVYAGDRGFYSRQNVTLCEDAGIQTESFPYRGGKRPRARTAHEHSPAFRDAQRFRAGVEGRISVLARGRGLDRCPLRGRRRFDLFVGAAILANNLKRIAAIVVARENDAGDRERGAARVGAA